jgi:hypothetical protein
MIDGLWFFDFYKAERTITVGYLGRMDVKFYGSGVLQKVLGNVGIGV